MLWEGAAGFDGQVYLCSNQPHRICSKGVQGSLWKCMESWGRISRTHKTNIRWAIGEKFNTLKTTDWLEFSHFHTQRPAITVCGNSSFFSGSLSLRSSPRCNFTGADNLSSRRTVKSARCLINYGLFKEMKNLGGNNPPVSAKPDGLYNATSQIEP